MDIDKQASKVEKIENSRESLIEHKVEQERERDQWCEERLEQIDEDARRKKAKPVENSISYQGKLFYEQYGCYLQRDLKKYYIDIKGDGKEIWFQRGKVNVVDKGDHILGSIGRGWYLKEEASLMLDIADAKGWDLLKMNCSGTGK